MLPLIQSFQKHFISEQQCIDYLFQLKWPDGFRCPRCNFSDAYRISSRQNTIYECKSCKHQTSLTAGTIMERSRTSIYKWLLSIYLLCNNSLGINATILADVIKVTYKTAWLILHKIRSAVSQADAKQPLKGKICCSIAILGMSPFRSSIELTATEHPVIVGVSEAASGQYSCKIKTVPRHEMSGLTLSSYEFANFRAQHIYPDASNPSHARLNYWAKQQESHTQSVFKQVTHWLQPYRGLKSKHRQLYLDMGCYVASNVENQGSAIVRMRHLAHICQWRTESSQVSVC